MERTIRSPLAARRTVREAILLLFLLLAALTAGVLLSF